MGECGCGEMNIVDSFLVGDKVIAVDLYHGCRYCSENPLGIVLHIFTKKQAKEWDINPKEQFKPGEFGSSERPFPFIGKQDLMKACKIYEEEFNTYSSLSDFMEDFGLIILQLALKTSWETFKKGIQTDK